MLACHTVGTGSIPGHCKLFLVAQSSTSLFGGVGSNPTAWSLLLLILLVVRTDLQTLVGQTT